MTARVAVRNGAVLLFAERHRLVVVANLQQISRHQVERRTGGIDVAVRIDYRMRGGIALEAFESANGAQGFQIAVNARAISLGSHHLVNQVLPARIVYQARVGIFADNVRHWRPVEIVLDAVLEHFPGVVDRLRKNYRVDDEVKLEFLLAAIIPGYLNVPLDSLGLSSLTQVNQIVTTPVMR